MGLKESRLAMLLGHFLIQFVKESGLGGFVDGLDAPYRLFAAHIRYPDVSYVSNERVPSPEAINEPIAAWAPNLAVEVISPGNTAREMDDKLRLFFESGVELVWYVYPQRRDVHVFDQYGEPRVLGESDELDGEGILPGFRLSIRQWFDEAEIPQSGDRRVHAEFVRRTAPSENPRRRRVWCFVSKHRERSKCAGTASNLSLTSGNRHA